MFGRNTLNSNPNTTHPYILSTCFFLRADKNRWKVKFQISNLLEGKGVERLLWVAKKKKENPKYFLYVKR